MKHWVNLRLRGQIQLISNGTYLADDCERPINLGESLRAWWEAIEDCL
jgi:hypothetical protein